MHETDFIQFDLFYIYINYYDHNDITFKQINCELADDHIDLMKTRLLNVS